MARESIYQGVGSFVPIPSSAVQQGLNHPFFCQLSHGRTLGMISIGVAGFQHQKVVGHVGRKEGRKERLTKVLEGWHG
jgi:hypothetical protein